MGKDDEWMVRVGRLGFILMVLSIVLLVVPAAAGADKLDDVRRLVEAYYYEEVPREVLQEDSVEALVSRLDGYSVYMDYDEFQAFTGAISTELVGIGVYLEAGANGITVVDVIAGSGAAAAGVRAGDLLVAVDGRSLNGASIEEAKAYIRGEAGSQLRLQVYRSAEEERLHLTVVRERVTTPTVHSEVLGGHVGYIQLKSFGERSADEIVKAIGRLGDVGHYIVDLRSNQGGYLEAAKEVLGLFPTVENALLVNKRGLPNVPYAAVGQEAHFSKPVSVLVNGGSASASEIVAGALKDYQAARLVGQTTFGKGTMQSLFYISPNVEKSDVLKLTVGEFLSPAGKQINTVGVVPDVNTEVGDELVVAHRQALEDVYGDYMDFGQLQRTTETKSFRVQFSTAMIWSEMEASGVELVEVGGGVVPCILVPLSETTVEVQLQQSLEADKEYVLYVHAGQVEAANGLALDRGYKVHIEV